MHVRERAETREPVDHDVRRGGLGEEGVQTVRGRGRADFRIRVQRIGEGHIAAKLRKISDYLNLIHLSVSKHPQSL